MSKQRSYKWKGGSFRDITTFVIAAEGAEREVRYFEDLAANRRRIQVKVLGASLDTLSRTLPAIIRFIW